MQTIPPNTHIGCRYRELEIAIRPDSENTGTCEAIDDNGDVVLTFAWRCDLDYVAGIAKAKIDCMMGGE